MLPEYNTTVIEKKSLTDDTIFISLKVPSEFKFKAGQYIFFKIEREDKMQLRPYSILSHPKKEGKLDFCVKLIDDGFASESFKATNVGDEFKIRGPLGHFVFDEEAKHEIEHWFICSGTGITPLYSMLKEHFDPSKKFVMLFGGKYEKDLLFYEELKEMENKNKNFIYLPTLSKGKWAKKTGRVQEHLPDNLDKKIFYICGLKDLVLDTKKFLLDKGVDHGKIRFERYS